MVIQVWGAHEHCDLEAMKQIVRPFLPSRPAATLGRATVAVAGLAVIVGRRRERELETAIVDGLAPFRTPAGSYRLSNEFHYLIARA